MLAFGRHVSETCTDELITTNMYQCDIIQHKCGPKRP